MVAFLFGEGKNLKLQLMINSTKEKIEALINSGILENIHLGFQLAKGIGDNFYLETLFNTESKIRGIIDIKKDEKTPNFKILEKKEKNNIDLALNFAKALEEEKPELFQWTKLFDFAFHNYEAFSYYDYGDFYHSIQLLFKFTTFRIYNKNNSFKSLPHNIYMLSHLKELYLWDVGLKILPDSFGKLLNLTHLNLARNNLQLLPDSFGNLVKLESLNMLESGLKLLPKDFGNLMNLKELDLSGNELLNLPENFGNLSSLEELDLSENLITELPSNFECLTNLKKLNLKGDEISSFQLSQKQLPNLNYLNLFYNEIPSLEKERITQQFPNCEVVIE
ncbi:MAG: leucine-rich repeat domain-containing protein [Aureispira sp.]|nr:leucine-rich repeat domain-containing protein [Aureispira sp.]